MQRAKNPSMEKSIKFLLLILLSSSAHILASAPASSTQRTPRQLAHTALAVSAKWARDASEYFSKIPSARSTAASSRENSFGDCALVMDDSARKLQRSVGELGRLGPAGSKGFAVRMSNVQTWVSAALTDQETCLAGLHWSGGAGAAVRKKVAEVRRATSTALALVNRIG